jgi:two-component sensor histidine kinase
MQLRKLDNEVARRALEECQTRILAIALIHEKLYQSKDYGRVPFHDYIRSIAGNVFDATGVSSGHVALELAIQPVAIAVDKAIPCGLLVNELITNALKHAFPGDGKGTVRVALSAEDERIRLSVKDDGVGLPDTFDIRASKTMGVQLISTLVDQLDASLEVERRPGATFRVTFAA